MFEKRKKNQVVPFFLIIEEAHNFCPERSFGESPSSYIIRNIASEGRKFGLGLGIVTQRPARVDKNVLSQCNTQIIQKVTNPNDLKAIASSAENISTSVVDDIATLPIGTALVIGAAVKPVLVDVRVRKSEHGGKSVSLDYKPAPEENNIKTVKINLLKLDAQKSITPAYLAVINNKGVNYSLLINDECKVMEYADNKLKPISQKRTEGLGAKSETILNIINEKGTTNISHLFNSLNYSFQDVDFILRELQNKRLILIQGSRLISNNNINFADSPIHLKDI